MITKVKLEQVCEIQAGGTPSRSRLEYWNNGTIPWVKISDLKSKLISETEEFITEEGLNNSSTKLLKKGTLLYTIFATLGEVAILDIDATTNQAIAGINITSNRLKLDYLYYYLLSIKNDIKNIGRGVAQNNINLSILKNLEVPLPSNEEQNEIIFNLNCVTKLLNLRKIQLEKLDVLVKSRFIEMFGDPVENPMGWKKVLLNSIGELNRGISKHRPRNDPKLLGGIYPLIQTGDVANSELYINEFKMTYSEIGLNQSKMWKKGTLCITIAANIAKTSILKFDACFPDSIVGFIPNKKTNTIFIHNWFTFYQKILENEAPESAQKNINLKILRELEIILPPLSLQNKFADFVQQVDKSKFEIKQSLEKLETVKKALMQEYFG